MTNAARREQHSPHKGGSYAVPEPGVGSENSALKEAGKNRKEKKKPEWIHAFPPQCAHVRANHILAINSLAQEHYTN